MRRPGERQSLAAGEDFFHDDVGRARRRRAETLQPLQVLLRIPKPVDMVDAQAGDLPLAQQPPRQRVGFRKDVGLLHAHADQRVDGEEPAVIRGENPRLPMGQAVMLPVEHPVERVKTGRAARFAVQPLQRRLHQALRGGVAS